MTENEKAKIIKKWAHSRYCSIYDAQYHVPTSEWLEKGCKNQNCEFCGKRPEKHPKDCICFRKKGKE